MKDLMKQIGLEIQSALKEAQNQCFKYSLVPLKDRVTIVSEVLERYRNRITPQEFERLKAEFLGWGCVQHLMDDPDVTEILINNWDQVWYEKQGILFRFEDHFLDDASFDAFVDRFLMDAQDQITKEMPVAFGDFKGWRYHIVGFDLTQNSFKLSLRRLGGNHWNLEKLAENGFCDQNGLNWLSRIVRERHNFLVVGGTGTGKTTLLNSLLKLIEANQRVGIIEDTSELVLPNSASFKLLTRPSLGEGIPEFTMLDLLKNILRMRPDRIVMGEIRAQEAKDFLLALSSGHAGSAATLHANTAQEALLRLQMLVQMGAPEWSSKVVSQLISQTIHFIIVIGRDSQGKRFLKGIYRLASLEEVGFTFEPCYQAEAWN